MESQPRKVRSSRTMDLCINTVPNGPWSSSSSLVASFSWSASCSPRMIAAFWAASSSSRRFHGSWWSSCGAALDLVAGGHGLRTDGCNGFHGKQTPPVARNSQFGVIFSIDLSSYNINCYCSESLYIFSSGRDIFPHPLQYKLPIYIPSNQNLKSKSST